MKRMIIAMCFGLMLVLSGYSWACTSDFSCGSGQKCVKAPMKTFGVCMDSINQYGIKQYDKDTKSFNPKYSTDGCSFNTDCPFGFRCDRKLKACIKK